jgi:hypothetical protein
VEKIWVLSGYGNEVGVSILVLWLPKYLLRAAKAQD